MRETLLIKATEMVYSNLVSSRKAPSSVYSRGRIGYAIAIGYAIYAPA